MQTYDLDLQEGDAAEATRTVHLRINVGGRRVIGFVDLPPAVTARSSGILNDTDRYLTVHLDAPSDAGERVTIAVNKEAISYVEVVGEPTAKSWVIPGTFCPVVIELHQPDMMVRGELFVLADTEVVAVLNDDRRFMSVRNAQVVGSQEAYAFLAIGKAQTRAVHF